MSDRGLWRVLAYARKNPEAPVKKNSKNAVKKLVESMPNTGCRR
jgi:hypothetical protein